MGKKISLPVLGDEQLAAATVAPLTRAEGGTVMTEIEREVTTNPIVLYMKGTPYQPQCGFSARAVQILQRLGREFHTVDILADPEKRQAIKEYGDWPTIPQLYIHGELVGGSDIMLEMFQSGELESLLNGKT